jgi:hypothetical protein
MFENIYSISVDSERVFIKKRDMDYLSRKGSYAYKPQILINPDFKIDNGVLTIKSEIYDYYFLGIINGFSKTDIPVKELPDDYKSIYHVNENDVYKKDIIVWEKYFFFKKPVKIKNVEFLKSGYYFNIKDNHEKIITTSNFLIVDEL